MSSLKKCLQKIGLEAHEQAIIRGYVKDYRDEGYKAHDSATRAVKDYIDQLVEERASIEKQIEKQRGRTSGETERASRDETKSAPSEPKTPGEKHPWEMTRKEFFEQAKSRITSSGSDSYYNPPDGRRTLWSGTRSKWAVALRQHHSEIMYALRSGEKIPEAVLAEYKDRIVSPEYSEQLKGWALKLSKMETATQTPYVPAEARGRGAGPGGAPAELFAGKAIYKTKEEAISEAVRRYYIPEGLLKAGTPSAEKAPVAAEKPDRPTLTLVGEKQMPKVQAEMRTKGKDLGKAQQGGIEFGAPKSERELKLEKLDRDIAHWEKSIKEIEERKSKEYKSGIRDMIDADIQRISGELEDFKAKRENLITAGEKLELKPEPVSAKEAEGAKIVKERIAAEDKNRVDNPYEKHDNEQNWNEVNAPKSKYTQLPISFSDSEATPKSVAIPGLLQSTVRTRMATTGSIRAGSLYARGPAEAASLLAHIRKSAQEHLYIVTTDKSGKVIEVHRYAKGTKGAASVNPLEVVGYVLNVPGAKRAFVAHNHPTGNATASAEDVLVMSEIERGLNLSNIETTPIIIAGTRWKTLNPTGEAPGIPAANRKESLPVKERVFALHKPGKAIMDPGAAISIKNELFGNNTEGWMLQNASQQVIGFVEYPKGKTMAEGSADLFRAIEKTNANAGVFFSNDPLGQGNNRRDFLESLQKAIGKGFQLNDVFVSGQSMLSTHGKIGPLGVPYDYLKGYEQLKGGGILASVKLNPESKLDIPEFIGTRDAIDFGRTATADQIDEMQRLHGVLADRSQEILKQAESSTDLELFEKAVKEAYRAQFLEEAVQSSAGNAAEMIAKGEWGRENILASVKQSGDHPAADKVFSDGIAKWETLERNESVGLTYTPTVLQMLGAEALPMEIDKATIRKVLQSEDEKGGKHGRIGIDQLQDLPRYLSNPIMVFESKGYADAFVVMTEMTDKDGDTVVAAVHLSKMKQRHIVNDIASVYGKDNENFFIKEIKAGRLRYLDKQRSRKWSLSRGLYLPPEGDLLAASEKSILSDADLVKYNDAPLFSVKKMSPAAQAHLDALRKAMPDQFTTATTEKTAAGTEAMSEAAMKPTPATAGVNTPTVFTKPIPKGSTRSETLKKVEEILELPIRVGKYRKRHGAFEAAGIYKPGPQVVRLGKANDIEVAAHEVAHHVQNLLGLGGKMPKEIKAMAYAGAKNLNREGFAEFVRYYITDPKKVATEAPAFLKTFEEALGEHVDVADALTRIKQSWNAWQAAAPVAKVLSVIQRGKKSDKHYSFDELYRDTVDELHPLKLLSDAVKGKTGEALEIAKDPFMLAWLNRGWARKAEQFIRHGTFQMDEAEGVKFTGASLREILAPVEKTGRMELLDAYLVAKRAVSDERIIKGFDRIISKDDFQKTVDELEAEFKDTAEKLYKYNDELVTYLVDSGRISEEVAKAIREKNEFYAPLYRVMDDAPPQGGLSKKKYDSVFNPIKRLKGSSRDIHSPTESMLKNTYAMVNSAERNRVGKAILDITEIDGMGGLVERIPFPQKPDKISKDDFVRLLKQWGDFKSVAKVEQTQRETERVISDLAAAGKTPSGKMVDVAMEALKSRGWSDGEAKQIISRLQSADSPQAKKEIIEKTVEKTVIMTIKEELSLENMPDEVISTFRPNYIAGPNEAIFYDKGKPVLVELEPMLARAVKGLDADGMNILTKILSYPAKWLRAGATLTPEFMARNPMRDQMTAWVYSKYGFIPGWDLVLGIAHIIGKTELYQKYNASGAAHAAMVSLDRDYLSKSLQEITRMQTGAEMLKSPAKAAGRLVFKVVRHPLETLQVLSELTEEGTRVGEFANAFKKGGGDLSALLTAGHAARDITLDFSRVGLKTRSMNAITAFWNAQVQGTDKMVRAFKESPGKTFAKAVLGITIPSLLLWYAQHDDPYYEEIPTWRRIMFWNIITHNEDGSLKNIWSIPKPFELGILFGSVPEMALDWMKEKDSKGFQDTMRAAGTALLPGFIPTAAIPVIEAFANRSLFFDRPIVPRNKEEVEPYLQAGPRTSEIVKLGVKMIKDVPGLKEYASPAKIQNMIVGWTGGMGRMTLDAADRMIKKFGLVKVAPEPSMTVDDIPGIRGFHTRFPTANTRSIERFYDSYIENKRKWESVKEEAGIRGKGIRLEPSYKVGMGMEAVLIYQEKAAKMLSLLRKSVDNTYKDPNLDPEQKRVLIDNTYIRMINVARAGLNKKPIPLMDLAPNMQQDQEQPEMPAKLTIQEALKMMK